VLGGGTTLRRRGRIEKHPQAPSMWDSEDVGRDPQLHWPAIRRRFEFCRRWLPPGPVLDSGGGTGWLGRALPLSDVVTMDPSSVALRAANRLGTAVLAQGSAEMLPFRNSTFDGVALLEVLEHADDPHAILHECARVLTPGGTLVVSVPNGFGAYAFLVDRPRDWAARRPALRFFVDHLAPSRYLTNRLRTHISGDIRLTHERSLGLHDWMDLFSACGFAVREVSPTEGLSPLVGLPLKLIYGPRHRQYAQAMWSVGKVDERLLRRLPLTMASGWAFALRTK